MKKIVALIIIILLIIVGFVGFSSAIDMFHPNEYTNYINEYSKEYNLDPILVRAVIETESKYNPNATSNVGAKGLMQITDSTGQWIADQIGIKDFNPEMLFDPKINIEFGCWYLANLNNEFHNEDNVAAAYNAGRNNVKQWLQNKQYSKDGQVLDVIPFSETATYVKRINFYEKVYKFIYRHHLN